MSLRFIGCFMSFVCANPLFAASQVTEYGIHLFFNETEFVDVMTLTEEDTGALTGEMIVPNDFTGPLLNIKVDGQKLYFEVLVPKNAARPVDLLFVYEAQYFDASQKQMIGFVRIKERPEFVASFVAFKREP